MSYEVNETLSAIQDGEASELELRRFLKTATEEDMDTWQRYQRTASVIREDKGLFAGSDISSAVAEAIAEEQPLKQAATIPWKPVASFAAAASITLALFTGIQVAQNGSATGVEQQVQVAATADANLPVATGANGLSLTAENGFATVSAQLEQPLTRQMKTESTVADAIAAERLQTYLEQHTTHSALNTSQGVLPFVRVDNAE